MNLYHYTSLDHLQQILSDKKLKLTQSNLLRPVNPRIENGTIVSDTDYYKPVVWFSSVLNFDKAKDCGLSGSFQDKTEAVIVIKSSKQPFYKWSEWAKKNGIEKQWFNDLKKTAPLWNSFYITELPVKIDNDTGIIFRPDIAEELTR